MDRDSVQALLNDDITTLSINQLESLRNNLAAELDARRGMVERGFPLNQIPDEWDALATDKANGTYTLYKTPSGYVMVDSGMSMLDVAASGTDITQINDWGSVDEIVCDYPGKFHIRIGNEWQQIKFKTPGSTPMGSIR